MRSGMIEAEGAGLKSRLRVSTVHGRLHLHSAYPTDESDAVFLGPDSYRFANLIAAELQGAGPRRSTIIDIGTGAGVGGIVAASLHPGAAVTMTDINPKALRLARINARHAGIAATFVEAGDLSSVTGGFDAITINPPYIIDPAGRAYRDGGDRHGARIALNMTRMALERIAPGGRLVLYTGSAIVRGRDALHEEIARMVAGAGHALAYHELDPDVFGEELDRPEYAEVDRIALVAAIVSAAG